MNDKKELAPERNWHAALAMLQTELPKVNHDTWVKPLQMVSYQDGIFQVSCINDYGKNWIETHIKGRLEDILSDGMGIKVFVRIDTTNEININLQNIIPSSPNAAGESENDIELNLQYHSIRDIILEPQRVVRIPLYFLRWLPYVSSRTIFVVIAFWQEYYLSSTQRTQKNQAKVSVRAERICQWAGISRAQFFRLFESDCELGWFIKKIETDHEFDKRTGRTKKSPNRYCLYDMPLTPGDAVDLKVHLLSEGIETNPLGVLQRAVSMPPNKILHFPFRLPDDENKKQVCDYFTVHGIVQELIDQKLSAEMMQLCDQLSDRLLARNDFMLVSWYFLTRWLPLIGHDAAMLVLLLRSQCYFNQETGIIRDEVWIKDGFDELAKRLGIKNPRMISNWFPAAIDRGKRTNQWTEKTKKEFARREQFQALIGYFVERVDHRSNPSGSYAWKFKVQRNDPLTPDDETLYQAVIEFIDKADDQKILQEFIDCSEDGLNGCLETIKKDVSGQPSTMVVSRRSKPINGCSETLKQLFNDCFETVELGCNDCFETLLKILKAIKDTKKEKTTISNQDTDKTRQSHCDMIDEMGGWSLEKILSRANIKNRNDLINQEKSAIAFVSWVFYGTSQSAIQDPYSLAIAKLKQSPGCSAGGVYDRLAMVSPKTLASWISSELDYQSPMNADWQRLFGQIKHERLLLLADSLGIDHLCITS
jgi:hypothetical protein